jgi:hypothetical protein
MRLSQETSVVGVVREDAGAHYSERIAAEQTEMMGEVNFVHLKTSLQPQHDAPSNRTAAGQRHIKMVPPAFRVGWP